MIVIRLISGLGDQLFIYAFARSLVLKYKTRVYIDTVSGFRKDGYKIKYELVSANSDKIIIRPEPYYWDEINQHGKTDA